MKISTPEFEMIRPQSYENGLIALRAIETMARISHRTEERQTEDSWLRFIEAHVLQHGDWSVTEHASATVLFHVNRGITHELVRHRLFGFTQESTRFVNYSKEGFEAVYIPSIMVKSEDISEWIADLQAADAVYRKWLKRGYPPQIARDHLPHALAAKIAVTGNFRMWRHFLLMRTTLETHPDCRAVTIPLLTTFKERIPLLYDDVIPHMRQVDNLKKPR